MKEKLGPLPYWAWALIVGGGIGATLLVKKAKGTTGTTGEVIPELAGQALPSEGGGGGGAAGSLESAEAKNSADVEALRAEVSALSERTSVGGGLGSGIGEVIEAREALETLGLSVGNPQHNTEPAAASNSAVKKATGKGRGFPLNSSRGKYRSTTFRGHAAHQYQHPVTGGVGPKKNIVVLGGPAKVTHAASGSHAPAHVSKPPAHHTAPKPVSKPAVKAAPRHEAHNDPAFRRRGWH